MIRLLLVEDDSDRHAYFLSHLPTGMRLVWARSGGVALSILKKDEEDTYSGIMLDFDLGEQKITPSDIFTNGGVVAAAIARSLPTDIPVLVHSMNNMGAHRIVQLLGGAGFPVTRVPFANMTREKFSAWLEAVEARAED